MSKLELYFAGAEVPTWRKLLVQEEVPHVAVNYLHLKARLPLGKWTLEDHFPPDQKIFLLSGSSATEKKNWSPAQHEEFLESYVAFVSENLDRLSYFTEYDAATLGLDWVLLLEQHRPQVPPPGEGWRLGDDLSMGPGVVTPGSFKAHTSLLEIGS